MQPLDFLLNRDELFLAVQRCLKSRNRSVFSADHIESQGKKWYNGLRIRDKTDTIPARTTPCETYAVLSWTPTSHKKENIIVIYSYGDRGFALYGAFSEGI